MDKIIVNYSVRTNEDWTDSLEFTDGGDPAEALDLTGSSFRAQLRLKPEAAFVYLDASTANGLLVMTADPGALSWNVAQPIIATIPPGIYVYDIVWLRDGSKVDVEIEGTVEIKRGVTR